MTLQHPMLRWLVKQLAETESDYTPLSPRSRNQRTSHEQHYILTDIAAKRRVLERHPPDENGLWVCAACPDRPPWPCPEIRDIAVVFAHRTGYRKEWKPQE